MFPKDMQLAYNGETIDCSEQPYSSVDKSK